MSRIPNFITIAGAAVGLTVCGDSTSPRETTGDLRVYVTTVGLGADPDGYVVTLDGLHSLNVSGGDAAQFGSLAAGSHTVELSGVAANCASSGTSSSVTVRTDSTSRVTFDVLCMAAIPTDVEIAFTRSGRIYGMRADGSGLADITGHPSTDAAWSPDGAQLAFTSFFGDTPGDIYVASADGTRLKRITSQPGKEEKPRWSPDGKQLVYWGSTGSDLYIVDVVSGETRNATQTPAVSEFDPAWSPDGSAISFVRLERDAATQAYSWDIVVRSLLDGSERMLTTDRDINLQNQYPKWSPDGGRIAFVREFLASTSHTEIWLINTDGTGKRAAVGAQTSAYTPEWSPDGSRIAFASIQGIQAIRSDGTGLLTLTTGMGHWAPAWRRR